MLMYKKGTCFSKVNNKQADETIVGPFPLDIANKERERGRERRERESERRSFPVWASRDYLA